MSRGCWRRTGYCNGEGVYGGRHRAYEVAALAGIRQAGRCQTCPDCGHKREAGCCRVANGGARLVGVHNGPVRAGLGERLGA